jgi:hypothetical protein
MTVARWPIVPGGVMQETSVSPLTSTASAGTLSNVTRTGAAENPRPTKSTRVPPRYGPPAGVMLSIDGGPPMTWKASASAAMPLALRSTTSRSAPGPPPMALHVTRVSSWTTTSRARTPPKSTTGTPGESTAKPVPLRVTRVSSRALPWVGLMDASVGVRW